MNAYNSYYIKNKIMSVSKNDYGSLYCYISSGDGEDDKGCSFTLAIFKYWINIKLPAIIKPERKWVDISKYEWAKEQNGVKGYFEVIPRQYGFSLSKNNLESSFDYLIIYLGRQSHDSDSEQSWSCFLPWANFRHHRCSFYGVNGDCIGTVIVTKKFNKDVYKYEQELEKLTPKVNFKIQDYDGAIIGVQTFIKEYEWRRGIKWCSFLSYFFPHKISRYLDIKFSAEVGPEKGSFKGGTLGHSIELLPNELHQNGFKRYCEKNELILLS